MSYGFDHLPQIRYTRHFADIEGVILFQNTAQLTQILVKFRSGAIIFTTDVKGKLGVAVWEVLRFANVIYNVHSETVNSAREPKAHDGMNSSANCRIFPI